MKKTSSLMLPFIQSAEFWTRALSNCILFARMIETEFFMLRKMGDAANWAQSFAKGVLSLSQLLPNLTSLVKDLKMNLTVGL